MKTSVKILASLAALAGLAAQTDVVTNAVIAFGAAHPHIVGGVAAVLYIVGLFIHPKKPELSE